MCCGVVARKKNLATNNPFRSATATPVLLKTAPRATERLRTTPEASPGYGLYPGRPKRTSIIAGSDVRRFKAQDA